MPPEESTLKKYDPTEHYLPLVSDTQQSRLILQILLERSASSLSPEIVRDKKARVDDLLSIQGALRARFRRVLGMFDAPDSAKAVLNSTEPGLIPAVEDICETIKDSRLRKKIERELDSVRQLLVPDVLERLGFLPKDLFDRDIYAKGKRDRRARLLSETFSQDFPFRDGLESVTKIDFSDLPSDAMQLPRFLRQTATAQWMTRVGDEFQECIEQAFAEMSELRELMVPEGEIGQPYEMCSDLHSKCLVELLEIMINPHLESVRRIEAFILLRHAITLFAINNHPIYKERLAVQNAIYRTLSMRMWDRGIAKTELPVTATKAESGNGAPIYKLAPKGRGRNGKVRGRRVREDNGIKALFDEYPDVIAKHDMLFFDSRAKSDTSVARKLYLWQERRRQYFAKCDGYDVPSVVSKERAQEKLADVQECLQQFQGDFSIRERTCDLKEIDDMLGFTFSVVLQKPLDEFSVEERPRVDECLKKFAEYLMVQFGLKGVRFENNLWSETRNPKSSPDFRNVKVHGFMSYETRDGEEIRMPIEVQIQPADVYLKTKSPGSSAYHKTYKRGQAQDLADIFLPEKVGGKPIYPRADTEALAEALGEEE